MTGSEIRTILSSGLTSYMEAVMPRLYDYTDYRTFLGDWYAEKKKANPAFSYRVLARKVGFKSPGHFTLILKGKTNISRELALKFASYLKLRNVQTEYFCNLVLFNQARTQKEKVAYLEKMKSHKEYSVRRIAAEEYEYFEKRHHSVIRAMLEFVDVKDDFRKLAQLIVPPISVAEVTRSVALMARLGLVKRDARGFWRSTDALVSSGNESTAVALNRYVLEGLKCAEQAIDRFAKPERNLSSVMVGVSATGFAKLQEEVREFRRRVMQLAAKEHDADRVYQLSIQLFPACNAAPAREEDDA